MSDENIELVSNGIFEIISASQKAQSVTSQCGDCDCACVPVIPAEQQSLLLSSDTAYVLNQPIQTIPLTDNYYAVLGQETSPVVLNGDALTLANHFRQPTLWEYDPSIWSSAWNYKDALSTMKQMLALHLVVPENQSVPTLIENSTTLSAWLHLTDRCNLRCVYCYLSHTFGNMSLPTGNAAIDATFRSATANGYQRVKFKYAGGEPLLRFPLVTKLHQYAQTLASQNGLNLDGVILSNGTLLTTEHIKEMQLLGLRLMISLDGLENFHDCQRSYANGRGSATDTIQAIELALEYGLIPDVSITVSGRNVDGLPELLDWIIKRDLPFSLNFYRESNFSAPYTDLRLEEDKIIIGVLAAYKIIESNLPRRSLLASLIDRANFSMPHLRTCSVGQSYLVFDSIGRVAKCQMDMNRTVTDFGDPDPLTTVRENDTGICNVKVDEKAECCDCLWRYWCTGGCSLMAYRATGHYDAKSPNCSIYRALYPEVVRLEGLRLLKYADRVKMSRPIQ
ncbi:MAG: radical SAM protein [Aestuariibacter sp.]|nr:radical SAM protein [Aestuariibacter sp.]